ncbi:UNVERIFIED_CONTAM: hypothetical protein FKN15_072819 [Acipenser sinensis]
MVEVDLQVQCKRVGLEEPVRCEAHPGLCSNALLYPQVAGIPVEAIRATVFYKQRWMLLLVDTSAACAKNPSVFDGTYLSWVTPRLLSPLVLHPTKFVDKQIKMGVEGRPLDEITATSRGYQLLVNSTAVKISIPFGAVGGYRKAAAQKEQLERWEKQMGLAPLKRQEREPTELELLLQEWEQARVAPQSPEPKEEEPPLPEPREEELPLPEPEGEELLLPEPRGEALPLPEPQNYYHYLFI